MSKDRLLSDEELQAEYLNMFRGGLEPLAKALGSQEEHFDELVKALAKGASAIANTQKRLYAESVIGEYEVVSGSYPLEDWKKERAAVINTRLAEQRARIK